MNYAILGNEKNFTVFKYGNRIIRFKAILIRKIHGNKRMGSRILSSNGKV